MANITMRLLTNWTKEKGYIFEEVTITTEEYNNLMSCVIPMGYFNGTYHYEKAYYTEETRQRINAIAASYKKKKTA